MTLRITIPMGSGRDDRPAAQTEQQQQPHTPTEAENAAFDEFIGRHFPQISEDVGSPSEFDVSSGDPALDARMDAHVKAIAPSRGRA